MDNATAEYAFIRQFFGKDEPTTPKQEGIPLSVEGTEVEESVPGSPRMRQGRRPSSASVTMLAMQEAGKKQKEEDAIFNGIWKQVMEPVTQYAEVRSTLSNER